MFNAEPSKQESLRFANYVVLLFGLLLLAMAAEHFPVASAGAAVTQAHVAGLGSSLPRVQFKETRSSRSSLDVSEYRVGRNTWIRFQETLPAGVITRRQEPIETELHIGCQSERPTARTRAPRTLETVTAPRPIYCLAPALPRVPSDCPSGTRRMVVVALGDRDDRVSAESLSEPNCTVIYGGAGADFIRGGQGADFICAGSPFQIAASTFQCGIRSADAQRTAAQDIIFGEGGNDKISGDGSINALHGGPGADTLSGLAGDDLLIGDEGNDQLYGGSGADMLDTNWFESQPGEQEQRWTKGNDSIDGEGGEDTVGYNHHTTGVTSDGRLATVSNGRDTFTNIETLALSKADDVFTPGPGFNLLVQALAGNDQINVAGDPSTTHNQRVECGPGEDSSTIDSTDDPNTPSTPPVGASQIRDDGTGNCESITYRAAH